MAATAAALSTYIQARENATRLENLTNWGGSGTSLDTTVLAAYCQDAINWFQATQTTYDPDTYPVHYTVAYLRAMQLLYARTDDQEKATEYQKSYEELLPGLSRRRSLSPRSNSPFTHKDISDTSTAAADSAFTYNHWSDFRAD